MHVREFAGTKLAYSDRGTGPVLLALHGALASGLVWEPLYNAMPGVRFVAPDLPGHGASGAASEDIHSQIVASVLEMIRATDSPVDLVGHSFGGTVALRFAVEHPEHVRSLTLIEPVFFAAALAPYRKLYLAHCQPQSEAMAQGDWDRAAQLFMADWGAGTPWGEMPKAHRDYIVARMPIVPTTAPAIIDDVHGVLAPGQLERAKMPVLLVEGTETQPIIQHIHNGLAERLPQARRLVLPGAGHMLPVTHANGLSYELSRLMAVA